MSDMFTRETTIRPVRDTDAQDLFGLLSLCFADYPGCYVDPHADLPDLVAPATSAAAKDALFEVVEDERGRVGACASVDGPVEGMTEIHRVYVRPDMRRRGLAARLIGRMEAEALRRGATRMLCHSDTRFTDAHRLYERLGYVRTGLERDCGDISGSREFQFVKALA